MKIEYQKSLILIYLEESLLYVYITRSTSDYWKICKKYRNKLYKIYTIQLNEFEKIDRTIYKLYDYHEEIYK